MKIKLKDDLYLWSKDELIEEQKTWDEQDKARNVDFTQAPYWLESAPGIPAPIRSIDQMAELLEDLFNE